MPAPQVSDGDVVNLSTFRTDQTFSLVDCTSFAVMERHGIEEAFTLDRHFRLYRYGPGHRKSFGVLP
jgi:predicted nucleic acid-binding protein